MHFYKYAEVALDRALGHILTYGIPEELPIQLGHLVEVSLRTRLENGIVVNILNHSDLKYVQPIRKILNEYLLAPDLLQLAFWMSKSYCTSLKKSFMTIFPNRMRKSSPEKKKRGTQDTFIRKKAPLQTLITWCQEYRSKRPAQARVLDVLIKKKKMCRLSELLEEAQAQESSLLPLISTKILEKIVLPSEEELLFHFPFLQQKPKQLSQDQLRTIHRLIEDCTKEPKDIHLLWGVTGSGKTEVYIHIVQWALKQGKKVIFLVPEISLIGQMVQAFRSRIQGQIAVFHSSLPYALRQKMHLQMQEGKIDLVIGTRSALFAPLSPVGLIILDEEHDTSYKSERDPCFHARDVAVKRAQFCNCPLILGSATPSMESFHAAQEKRYTLHRLSQKISTVKTDVFFVPSPKKGIFSSELIGEIQQTVARGEQALLFLNRRGYYEVALCIACRQPLRCPHCDLSLTIYINKKLLLCHICQYSITQQNASCSICKSRSMRFFGYGTERVEVVLQKIFPHLKILRIDRDRTTTSQKLSHDLHLFRSGKADILIGTQMITKGHHFPLVTLVGVLHPDQQLWNPDFRNGEYLVQLLTQVTGRVSREELPGKVLIQTDQRELSYYHHAFYGRYENFAHQELISRKTFLYPPFCFLVRFLFKNQDIPLLTTHALSFREQLEQCIPKEDLISPCSRAYRFKVSDQYRIHFILKTQNWEKCSSVIQQILKKSSVPRGMLKIDFHPTAMS